MALFALSLYLIPAIAAWCRGSHRRVATFWLNLLLGWSIGFWFLALMWAFEETDEEMAAKRLAAWRHAQAPTPIPMVYAPTFVYAPTHAPAPGHAPGHAPDDTPGCTPDAGPVIEHRPAPARRPARALRALPGDRWQARG